jgi:hypothetical protein
MVAATGAGIARRPPPAISGAFAISLPPALLNRDASRWRSSAVRGLVPARTYKVWLRAAVVALAQRARGDRVGGRDRARPRRAGGRLLDRAALEDDVRAWRAVNPELGDPAVASGAAQAELAAP